MLVSRIVGLGCEEGEYWRNIRPRASSEPVDAPHHALIAFCSSLLVGIIRGRRGDGIDWETRAIRSHVRNRIHVVNREAMCHTFGKDSLGEEDREVTVGVMTSGKSCAEKIIDCIHEINFNFSGQQLFE
jgi:hypothetical protein